MAKSTSTRLFELHNGAILALANVVVAVLLFAGALFLYEGLGQDFRILDYPSLKPYGMFIGLLLLGLGVATAKLWIFGPDRRDRDRQGATPPPAPPRRVIPQAWLAPPSPTAANENRAETRAGKVGAPNIGAHDQCQAAVAQRYGSQRTLVAYDATSLVGLRAVVHNGAVEKIGNGGEVRIDVPNLDELRAAAAILRCLLPIKLRGREMTAIRTIMGLGRSDLLGRLGEQAPSELLLRWESEDPPMDELTEKRFRHLVCEEVAPGASHLEYDAAKIAQFRIVDPWRKDPTYEIPPVILNWVQVTDESGSVARAWNDDRAA
jgi:hypothetical protein